MRSRDIWVPDQDRRVSQRLKKRQIYFFSWLWRNGGRGVTVVFVCWHLRTSPHENMNVSIIIHTHTQRHPYSTIVHSLKQSNGVCVGPSSFSSFPFTERGLKGSFSFLTEAKEEGMDAFLLAINRCMHLFHCVWCICSGRLC